MYSAIVAVLLVNLVLAAFVVHCFREGFPVPAVPEATAKDEVKEEKKEK